MKIALVTPWPPQATGIADYAYDLAYGLIKNEHEVTIITEELMPKPLEGVNYCHPSSLNQEAMDQFDKIVYQMGNNSKFHIYMIDLLFKYSGIVHLHDMVLHHIMAWILYANGDQTLYTKILKKWYGPYSEDLAYKFLSEEKTGLWDTTLVSEFPFFEEVLQYACKCIVHSNYTDGKIKKVFPGLNSAVLPQVYRTEIIKPYHFQNKCFHIGIFGGVDYNKRIDIVLRSVAEAIRCGANIDLHIVGSVSAECEYIYDLINELSLSSVVHLHGRLNHNDFLSLLSSVDLCIALRYPSMGETSAIVMRALQASIPVIVNDIGWYSELPSFIPKITPNDPQECQILCDLIIKFSKNNDELNDLRLTLSNYSKHELNFDLVIKDYVSFLKS